MHASLTSSSDFARKAFGITVLCQIVLIAIYWIDILTGSHFETFHSLFDLDSEANIPTWFSSAQLLCATLAFWHAATKRRATRVLFLLVGVATLLVSIDETAQIHERVTWWMGQRYVDWLPRFAGANFWVVMLTVAILIAVCQVLATDVISVWQNHRRATLIAFLGVIIGVTGGMGVETIGYKIFHGPSPSLWYKLEVTVEEGMEMFGASLLLLSGLMMKAKRSSEIGELPKEGESPVAPQIRLAS